MRMKTNNNSVIPRLRFPEFKDDGEWDWEKLDNITFSISSGKNNKVNNGKYLLYGSTGVIGKTDTASHIGSYILVARVGANAGLLNLITGKFGVSDNTLVISVIEDKVDINFVYYFLISFKLNRLIFGSGQPLVTGKQLKSIEFGLPTIPEQQKITDCLSSLDTLISSELKQLDALKSHKAGLLQQLFPAEGDTVPKVRFKEFEDDGDWEEISLIDVTDKDVKWSFIGGPFGSNLKASDYTISGIRVIQLQNIGDGEFIGDSEIYTSKEKANELLANNIYPNDIIMSKMGDPVGRACLIPNTHDRYVMCSDGIRLVVNERKFNKYFIYSLINSPSFRYLIERKSTGSTRKRIGLNHLKDLKLFTPKFEEQQKIADCLSSLDTLIQSQTKKIEVLKTHKQGLMQQLFPIVEKLT